MPSFIRYLSYDAGSGIVIAQHFKIDKLLVNYILMSHSMRLQQCGICDQQSLRSACAYAQSDQSLC